MQCFRLWLIRWFFLQVNLVEWLKLMVSTRNSEGVLDPKLPEKPSTRALKRTLLVALRCVDPDSTKRSKMSHVIHMFEADDYPYRDVSVFHHKPLRKIRKFLPNSKTQLIYPYRNFWRFEEIYLCLWIMIINRTDELLEEEWQEVRKRRTIRLPNLLFEHKFWIKCCMCCW